jgi:hypothetical protein
MSSYGSILFGATSSIWILYTFLWLFPVAYLILRWRAYREQTPADPHLGIKAALYYFKTLAYHVVLVGTFCLIFGLINDHVREEMMRLGAGLLLGGGLVYGAHAVIIDKRTNTHQFPAVARIYNGFNLVMTGLVAMAAVIGTLVLLFAEHTPTVVIRGALVLLLVYGAAWAAQAAFLLKRVDQPQK